MNYSNARKSATFNDWPLGGNKRGTCTFVVEKHPKRGERVGRTTTGATKYDTYAPEVAIVDGDDGRTYILSSTGYGFLQVSRSDFKNQESFFNDNPRYNEMVDLLKSAK